mgnify:CR=1 FL=1
MSLRVTGDDFNAPTNPHLSSFGGFSNGDRINTAIVKHGGVSVSVTGFGGTVTENSNLANTKGFRIKCYDSLTTTGVRFNPTDWNATTLKFTTNDYFVLIYSDSPLQHHFAKITEVKTEDLIGDAFEFEPKLGNEIPKDTKFIIFQVTQNTDIVALSLGLLQDTALTPNQEDQPARNIAVARPSFYFYDGLDKEKELDHNTKYFAMRESGTSNSFTLSSSDPSITFVTVQDFGKTVIDYSKFTHRVKLTDKLRDLDAAQSTNYTSNENYSATADTTNYNLTYVNARRISDDEINSPAYTGPTRYLHYDFSPTKSNFLYNAYDHINTESIDGKGGFSETSIIDNARIIPRKIKEFTAYRARHNIHSSDLNEFFPLKATYDSSTSAFVFSFETEYDLGTVLNTGDEVKLGDKILIVNSFGTLFGTTQTITFQNDTSDPYARGEDDGIFTAQTVSPSSGEVLHRRAYNANDGTLMLDTHLLNGRFSKMYVSFTSLNHEGRFASVTACDAVKNMLTLSFGDDSYNTNPLSFTKGQYQLFIERFNGEIESIESKKENGQTIVEIKGRDKFNKLLSPIVNLNTLFSEDIIYSSNSPYNKLEELNSGDTHTIALGDTQIDLDVLIANTSVLEGRVFAGVRLFGPNGYVGEITNLSNHTSSTKRRLIITPAITELNSEALYIDTEKNYVLTKAQGSNALATNKPSSLTGAANRGFVFTAGNKIKSIRKSATTTSSNTTVTVADTSDLLVGMEVKEHTFIPIGATIVSIDSDTTFTISSAATFNFTTDAVFFGGEDTSLIGTSQNTNEGAVGYAINSPSSISNDFAFQTLLKDEHGSAGKSSFDTVNTLIDFEIVSTAKKDNITEIELAPYIPITLGRKTDYHFTNEDNTFTAAGAVSVLHGSNTFDSLVSTNYSTYDLKRDDLIFVGNSSSTTTTGIKTFVGKITSFVVETYSDAGGTTIHEQKIRLDRAVHAFTVGEKLYIGTKKSNDLVFINGKHMWGGKINILPHPKSFNSISTTDKTNRGLVPLNLEELTGGRDYSRSYGQFYYKSKDFITGNFLTDNRSIANTNDVVVPKLYDNRSKLNYFTSNYQFKPNIASENLNEFNKTLSTYRTLPFDLRGLTTPYGASGTFRRIHDNEDDVFIKTGVADLLEAQYSNNDESASRLFLYTIGDILPYSSLRKDSIFNVDNKFNLSKYNLFLIENKEQKDSSLNTTNRLSLTDSNYQTVDFSTDIDISNLKRFGLMRLTELTFDFMFNRVNPEKPIKREIKDTIYSGIIGWEKVTLAGSGAISSIAKNSGNTADIITFTSNQTLDDGDFLFDSTSGHLIGTVTTGAGNGSNSLNPASPKTAFELTDFANFTRKNSGGFTATAPQNAVKYKFTVIDVDGRNRVDTFARVGNGRLHPLKCAIVPSDTGYGDDVNDWLYEYARNVAFPANANDEIYLPFVNDKFSDFAQIDAADLTDLFFFTNLFPHLNNTLYYGMLGVSLDRFSIEDGGASQVEVGATTGVLKNTNTVEHVDGTGTSMKPFSTKHFTIESDTHFKEFKNRFDDEALIGSDFTTSKPYAVDGSYMVFKPRLCIPSYTQNCTKQGNTTLTVADSSVLSSGMVVAGTGIPTGTKISSITNTTTVVLDTAATDSNTDSLTFTYDVDETSSKSSNGTVYEYDFDLDNITASGTVPVIQNQFLKLTDITGCYLAIESGKHTDGTDITFSTSTPTATTSSLNIGKRMNNVVPNNLIYVISHEVNSSDANSHKIVTDTPLSSNSAYRILQPNETCIYDFFPDKILLNTLSSSYTKIPNSNEVYKPKQDYTSREGITKEAGNTTENEGVLSMFVLVDTDKQSTDNHLVLRDSKNFMQTNFPNGDYNLYFSDGDENKKITVTSSNSENFSSFALGEGFNGKGVVSVSETFTVNSRKELKISPNRACIGTTVSIGLEGEDLINELLETEEIQFQTTGTDTPMFLAPNYQGVDLYSAINYILDKKDMKILEENDVFKIAPEDENEYYTDITIDDSGDYLISEFEKQTTLFDFFNEIIVYGSSHKATRKDIRSINSRGRKTLEVVDGTLLTQEEVDKRATKLLRIHSRFNQKLSFTMQNKGINQLRVGDIVTVSLPRENIETGEFIVLEMEHQLTGFIKLQLGRYTKDLSDIFSELLIASKETKSALRSADLTSNEVSFNFLDTLNTKELKLLVRKRSSTGAALGFTTPLGFGLPLGFGAGTITITDLAEEDLA